MYIFLVFEDIAVIISIFVFFIISYRKPQSRLKHRQILFKQKIRRPIAYTAVYMLLFICLVSSLFSGYIIGVIISAVLILLNSALQFKLLPHYFCIYKEGIAFLNAFKEINADYSWSSVKVFSFDSKDSSKAYIAVVNHDGNEELITLHITESDLDLFKMLMEKGTFR